MVDFYIRRVWNEKGKASILKLGNMRDALK